MTPRSLFNIILKVAGLFLIRELINSTLQTISSMIIYFTSFEGGQMLTPVVVSLAIVALYLYLIIQLLFKTNTVIDFLKLDQGFGEHDLSFDNEKSEFPLPLSSAIIIHIALIVIGGVILADEVPDACRHLYMYFSSRNDNYSATQPEMEAVVYSGVKILIALLLIGERNRITGFIENRKTTTDNEEPTETPGL